MPARLRGSFALLIWDSGRRRGLIAVDQLGAGSVVYRGSAGDLAFATELRDLVPLLDATPPPDERALVRWLVDGTREPDRTLVADIRRLPGGHLLRLGPAAHRREMYWRPSRTNARPLARPDAARTLRADLRRAVVRGCDRAQPNGILLSGGLDSTAVAAFARSAEVPLVAYSAVFPEHPAADESALVAERAALLGLPTGRVSFRSGGTLAATLRYLDTWKLPPASPNLFFHEPLLRLARREGIATMMDGQGGDELFGASPYLAADLLRSGRVASARRLTRVLLAGDETRIPDAARHIFREVALKGALPAWLHRSLRRYVAHRYAPTWLTNAGMELYAGGPSRWSWKETGGPRWWAYLADVVTRGRERGGVHDFLRHMLADAGLAGSHPLLEDVDLVKGVLMFPPALAFDRRFDRPLLRDALDGLLPDPIRLRTEKSFFNDVLGDAVHTRDDAVIRRLLCPEAELGRYVRVETFDRLRAVPRGRRGRGATWLLWRLAAAECWLRGQGAPGFAREALETWDLPEPRYDLLSSGGVYSRRR
jgi:asparagine synthase (glutamine-hydrolysing)